MRRIDRVIRLSFILLLAVPLFFSCKKRGSGVGNESISSSLVEKHTYMGIVKRVCDGDTYAFIDRWHRSGNPKGENGCH